MAVHAAVDSQNKNHLHLFLVNCNLYEATEINLSLLRENGYNSVQVWAFDGDTAEITPRNSIDVADKNFEYAIPSATVTPEKEEVPVTDEIGGDTIEPTQSPIMWLVFLGVGVLLLAGGIRLIKRRKKEIRI